MPLTAASRGPAFTRRHLAAALPLAALLAACGEAPRPSPAASFDADATLGWVGGARLVADPHAEFQVERAGLVEEAGRTIALGAALWGAAPATALDGWVIVFSGGWFPCRTAQGATWTWGCTYPAEAVIYAAPDDGPTRCRTSVLVHELGHVVLGDGDHADPRWALVPAVAAMACAGP